MLNDMDKMDILVPHPLTNACLLIQHHKQSYLHMYKFMSGIHILRSSDNTDNLNPTPILTPHVSS